MKVRIDDRGIRRTVVVRDLDPREVVRAQVGSRIEPRRVLLAFFEDIVDLEEPDAVWTGSPNLQLHEVERLGRLVVELEEGES